MILVVGSMNMDICMLVRDFPRPGETLLADDVHMNPGGKGANQAVAAGKSGAEVAMIGCVGEDDAGVSLMNSIRSAGVCTDYISVEKGCRTSTAYITVSQNGENSIVVHSSANMRLSPAHLTSCESLFEQADYCILQMEIAVETIRAAMDLCKKHHVKIVFNPSPLNSFDSALLPGIDYLVMNEEESSAILGIPCSDASEQNWRSFMEKNEISNVLITLGKKGCQYYGTDGASGFFSSRKRKAVDTTGAGDTFLGALIAELSRKEPIEKAIPYANAAAGLAVTKAGAQQAMPTRAEIEKDLTIAE